MKTIEEIALEESNKYDFGGRVDRALMMINFLARIDAERGKSAKAWINERNGFVCKEKTRDYHVPLFLSPTIPEGMVLAPVEPTEAMKLAGLEASYNALLGCCTANHLRIYRAMLAAAQGERNGN